MAMKEKQQMVRVPGSWWSAFVSHGDYTGRSGAEVARDVMAKGSEVCGIALPQDQSRATAEERKARKVEKLKAELAALE